MSVEVYLRWAVVGFAMCGLGFVLLTASLVLYFGRTRARPFQAFWLSKALMTRQEYVLNRTGFATCVLALLEVAALIALIWWRLHHATSGTIVA